MQIFKIDMRAQGDSCKPTVHVFSPITKQKEKILVNYNSQSTSSISPGILGSSFNGWSPITWITILMVIVILGMFCYGCLGRNIDYYGKDD